MTKPSTPTARHLRHAVNKQLFVAHLHLLGKPGLSQSEQLEAVTEAVKLAKSALNGLGELQGLLQARMDAFDAIASQETPATPSDEVIDIEFDAIVKGAADSE